MSIEALATFKPPSQGEQTTGLPPDWTQVQLGDIISLEYGRSLPDKARRAGTVPVYGSNGVVGWHDEALVPSGGIVVGRKGTAGSVTVSSDPFWPIDTTYFVKARQPVDADWLAAILHHARLNDLNEATGVPGLNRDKAYRQPLLLPPLDEQRRIAEVLRSVDEAIAAAHYVVSQAGSNLKAAISALVDCGGSSPDWRHGRCDSFFALQRGFDITESQSSPGPYRVISSSGPAYFHSRFAVAGPVVITGRKGRLGTVFYSDDACWPHDTTLWVKDFKGNFPRFVYWKLRGMDLEAYDAATSVPTLNRNNVHALEVAFPPVAEQVAISETLDAMLAAIEQEEGQLAALQCVKLSLMSDLLSGRVRVPA